MYSIVLPSPLPVGFEPGVDFPQVSALVTRVESIHTYLVDVPTGGISSTMRSKSYLCTLQNYTHSLPAGGGCRIEGPSVLSEIPALLAPDGSISPLVSGALFPESSAEAMTITTPDFSSYNYCTSQKTALQ